MIKYSNSTVFNVGADTIVNTVNCVGYMGKGLALECSLRFPGLLEEYKNKCQNNEIRIGELYYYNDKEFLIINFPTKKDYKYPSKIEWIEIGLETFLKTYKKYNIKKMAMPLLGCGNGGLNKKNIMDLMENKLGNLDIEIIICFGDKKDLEGKDLIMYNNFLNCDVDDLAKHVRLNVKQKENLETYKKIIKKFSDISKIPSIGMDSYRKIFLIFYNGYSSNKRVYQQSLF